MFGLIIVWLAVIGSGTGFRVEWVRGGNVNDRNVGFLGCEGLEPSSIGNVIIVIGLWNFSE